MIQDLRYAVRLLLGSPGFTIVAVLSLALGIGANTAIFSLVNAVLLRPIPVADPERLVAVFATDERNPGNLPLSHLNFKDLRDENEVFSDMAAFTFAPVTWSQGGEAEQVLLQVTTAGYFDVLGVRPALGRGFLREEDVQASPVIVLSHGFWQRSLGGEPGIVGRTLTLNRTPFTVIGVAPERFTGTLLVGNPAGWVPTSMRDVVQPGFDFYETRRGLFLVALGRLRPGVDIDQARANLGTISARLAQAFPDDNRGRGAGAVRLLDFRLNPTGQGAPAVQLSVVLMIVVGIVLLIACANIANLLLARATRRRREIAVRLALGAERRRLVRQLLTESSVLAAAGAALGTALAFWLIDVLVAADLALPLPLDETVAIDGRVLAFTGLLTLATGMLFGLAPAMQASKPDVLPVLKSESGSGSGFQGRLGALHLRQILVVAQVALSLLSLVAAGLFLRSLRHAQLTDTGFVTSGVLIMTVNLGREGYTPERGQLFYEQAVERLSTVPGVRAASVAQSPPLAGGGFSRSVFHEGTDTTTQDRVLVQVNAVGAGYFETIGIPVLRGRAFTRDDTARSPLVVVINETMAERFWPGEDAVGRRFRFFGDGDSTTVVGIARNSRYNGVAEDPIPFIYQPIRQAYSPTAALHVRAEGHAAALAPAVRRAVQEIDPTLAVFDVRTLEDQVSESLAPLRLNVLMLATFGVLALALASIGLYGVASYAVTQRTREIGVRMALGARPSSVLRLVLAHGLTLVGIGIAAGLAVALALSPLIPSDLLPNTSARDPLTLSATAVLLAAVALAANYLPARRATRIDPLLALRGE